MLSLLCFAYNAIRKKLVSIMLVIFPQNLNIVTNVERKVGIWTTKGHINVYISNITTITRIPLIVQLTKAIFHTSYIIHSIFFSCSTDSRGGSVWTILLLCCYRLFLYEIRLYVLPLLWGHGHMSIC